MTNSTNLALPFILSSQAQKHITHNEALLALDAVVQLSVVSKSQNEGALDASEGTRYIVPEDASGNFANQSGKIAAFQDGVYQFYTPQIGWLAYISDIGNYQFFDGLSWQNLPGSGTETAFLTLGVNASADLINRFSISSDASLFNNDGNGHQLKINKAQVTDTASLLFQTGFSGRAEFGLAGDDQFRIKTSDDGVTFHTALIADAATGYVSIGEVVPSATLTIGGDLKLEDPSSNASLHAILTTSQTEISALTNDADLVIRQAGDGTIIFSANETEILRLRDGAITAQMPVQLKGYSALALPDASTPGQMIFVSDSTYGLCMAFSDGTNWRRSEDRSVIA